jgi:nucleotidyltransferase substrate binding protein (TIGR01987 family)
MPLDISAFESAIARLQEGLARYQREVGDTQVRDGLIQRFKFTCELAHKTLKRYPEQTAANPAEIDTLAFQDLLRSANERGLLRGDWPAWRRFRAMRARTTGQTHDERTALDVVAGIPDFVDDVVFLRDALRTRLS